MGRKPKEPIDDQILKEPTPVEDGPFRKMATKVEAAPFRDRDTQVTKRPKKSPPDADSDPQESRTPPAKPVTGTSNRWLMAALILALAVILCQSIALIILLIDERPERPGGQPMLATQPTLEARTRANAQAEIDQATAARTPDHDAPGPEAPLPEADLGDADVTGAQPAPEPQPKRLPAARTPMAAMQAARSAANKDKDLAAGPAPGPDLTATLDLIVEPGGDVSIDGDNYGWCSRIQFPLSEGKHHLQVANEELGTSRDYDVRIADGEHRRLVVNLGQAASDQACEKVPGRFGSLSVGVVGGWAFVYIDGEKIRATPLLEHRVHAGKHRIVLKDGKGRTMRLWDICVKDGEKTRLVDNI